MPDYVYRVVNTKTGDPIEGGSSNGGRQHFYPKEATAKSVCSQKNNHEEWMVHRASMYGRIYVAKEYAVQRSEVIWSDLND